MIQIAGRYLKEKFVQSILKTFTLISNMEIAIVIVFAAIMGYTVWFIAAGNKKRMPVINAVILSKDSFDHIPFVQKLDDIERARFVKEAGQFLQNIIITPVNTTVSDNDKIYIAASAVIPMFYLPGWSYPNLNEVFVYGDNFNAGFETDTDDRNLAGLVGTGVYMNKMFLSKPAVQAGFGAYAHTSNTAIHEFVHLIDGADGETDGVPHILMPDKAQVALWLNLMEEEKQKIAEGNSDINPYALTKNSEFFAVASEYFFNKPELFEQLHPELFTMLQEVFQTKYTFNSPAF